MIGREQPDQMLRGVPFALDFDRLMGVRSQMRRPAGSGTFETVDVSGANRKGAVYEGEISRARA